MKTEAYLARKKMPMKTKARIVTRKKKPTLRMLTDAYLAREEMPMTMKLRVAREKVTAQRHKHLRLQQVRLQDKRKRKPTQLSDEKFRKQWSATRKRQEQLAKIRMPPREHKPTTLNELDVKELESLPGTVCLELCLWSVSLHPHG